MQASAETIASKNIARAAKLDTASISDALDRLGIAGQCYGIKAGIPRLLAGRASLDVAVRPSGQAAVSFRHMIDISTK